MATLADIVKPRDVTSDALLTVPYMGQINSQINSQSIEHKWVEEKGSQACLSAGRSG
jgi:hypothetical protein